MCEANMSSDEWLFFHVSYEYTGYFKNHPNLISALCIYHGAHRVAFHGYHLTRNNTQIQLM